MELMENIECSGVIPRVRDKGPCFVRHLYGLRPRNLDLSDWKLVSDPSEWGFAPKLTGPEFFPGCIDGGRSGSFVYRHIARKTSGELDEFM
jgi:hypothetical protein